MSHLTRVTLVILVLLFMPGAMAAAVANFDATQSRHLPLPEGFVWVSESTAFNGQGHDPYNSISDVHVLEWKIDKIGWTTYAYGPGNNNEMSMCRASKLCPETDTMHMYLKLLALPTAHVGYLFHSNILYLIKNKRNGLAACY